MVVLCLNGISFGTALSFPDLNYVVTVDLETNNVKISNSFRAYVPANGVTCSGAATGPSSAVTNNDSTLMGQFLLACHAVTHLYIPVFCGPSMKDLPGRRPC